VDNLDPEVRAAIGRGVAAARAEMAAESETLSERINGWMVMDPFGDRDFFGDDYMKRAVTAMVGWGGNDQAEAYYPMARVDAEGNDFDGANKYQMTVDLPIPVNAFWSVTMYDTSYDGTAGYMIKNPIDRYLINSTTEGLAVDHGRLTITMQHDEPTDHTERANWLPAPEGRFYINLRLYWPKLEALDGTWSPPPVHRIG